MVARRTDGQPTMLSFVWMDRDRRYFIASASLLDSGIPYSRNKSCWSWMHCLRTWNSPSRSPKQQKSITEPAVLLIKPPQSTSPRQFENQKETGDKEMGHEGQLNNILDDCCGYLACVFTGNGFYRSSIRVLCTSCRRID